MKLKPVELFLALGLATTFTACAANEVPETAAPTDEAPAAVEKTPAAAPATPATPATGAPATETPGAEEGGEGGEGGEG
jgi:hypothetical protein